MSTIRPLILIIDDDTDIIGILAAALGDAYAVIGAFDGLDGYALACQRRPAVILLDVTMPIVDGWTVLRKLRSNPAASHSCVVIVTAAEQEAVRREGEKHQVFEVIHKPVDVLELRKVLARAVHSINTKNDVL